MTRLHLLIVSIDAAVAVSLKLEHPIKV